MDYFYAILFFFPSYRKLWKKAWTFCITMCFAEKKKQYNIECEQQVNDAIWEAVAFVSLEFLG